MTLTEVNAAYQTLIENETNFSIFFKTPQGIIASILFVIFIIVLGVRIKIARSKNGEDEDKQGKLDITAHLEFIIAITFIIPAILVNPFVANSKDELIVKHPDYEEYVESYVKPYLASLPATRYDNLKIEDIPRSGLYLTHTDVNAKSLEKEKRFKVRELKYALIEDNQSSYILERILEDDLGGKYEDGYKITIAYINETDRKIIEEHLGYEIDLGQN